MTIKVNFLKIVRFGRRTYLFFVYYLSTLKLPKTVWATAPFAISWFIFQNNALVLKKKTRLDSKVTLTSEIEVADNE